jgi:SNF2 family DNA or RNA helicase
MTYEFKTKPMEHQYVGLAKCLGAEAYALLLEMGCGKTKIAIDKIGIEFTTNKINRVLVIAPNGVHHNWVAEELPKHLNLPYTIFEWGCSGGKKYIKEKEAILKPSEELHIVTINVEALSTEVGKTFCAKFLKSGDTLMIIDESSRIKNPSAMRTKAIITLGKSAKQRLILTGTPITQSPVDAYAQFKFLDPKILGASTFTAFKHEYCITRPMKNKFTQRSFDSIVGFKNLDKLKELIAPYSYRVTKEECLDLPEKIYKKCSFPLSHRQRAVYDSLATTLMAEIDFTNIEKRIVDNINTAYGSIATKIMDDPKMVTTQIILTKLLRLQQICGGFVTADDESEPTAFVDNPKLDLMMELLEDIEGKVIIWARFKAEIKAIVKALQNKYGHGSVVQYWGEVAQTDRNEAVELFQMRGISTRFFVGNPHSGGIGLTLTAATTMIYYSNDFSLETRLQSEDRAHRIGQKKNVTYIDLVAENTIDEKVMEALRNKQSVANLITGDNVKQWI